MALVPPAPKILSEKKIFYNAFCPLILGSTNFRRGRLGTADYAPGLLGTGTFRRRDF